ncbi:MAG: cation:dicarboxylase symporter family transporter, partial [Pirellulaceae bacterium]|nr:cation:dicarboxylase symporter family transporter [Pirellulaceae bacterium]
MNRHTILTIGIFIGLVLGAVLGELLYRAYTVEVTARQFQTDPATRALVPPDMLEDVQTAAASAADDTIVYSAKVPAGWLETLSFVGKTCFMGLLKMVLVPLIASSVIVGVASIGDPSRLGVVGLSTVVYYFGTMLIAVVIGVVLVTSIRPGEGIEKSYRDEQQTTFEVSQSTAQSR